MLRTELLIGRSLRVVVRDWDEKWRIGIVGAKILSRA